MSCLTLWCCSDHTSRFWHHIYEIHCINFLFQPLDCTQSILSAIIRDKGLITNNLYVFFLFWWIIATENQTVDTVWSLKGLYLQDFFRLLYMQTVSLSLTVVQKSVKREIDYYGPPLSMFFFSFSFFFMIISWDYFFIFFHLACTCIRKYICKDALDI